MTLKTNFHKVNNTITLHMRPRGNPPDGKEGSDLTKGWHLDIPAHVLAGMTHDQALATIRSVVNILENDDRIPFNDWIEQNLPKNEPPKIPEPGALVHKEIYPFRD